MGSGIVSLFLQSTILNCLRIHLPTQFWFHLDLDGQYRFDPQHGFISENHEWPIFILKCINIAALKSLWAKGRHRFQGGSSSSKAQTSRSGWKRMNIKKNSFSTERNRRENGKRQLSVNMPAFYQGNIRLIFNIIFNILPVTLSIHKIVLPHVHVRVAGTVLDDRSNYDVLIPMVNSPARSYGNRDWNLLASRLIVNFTRIAKLHQPCNRAKYVLEPHVRLCNVKASCRRSNRISSWLCNDVIESYYGVFLLVRQSASAC